MVFEVGQSPRKLGSTGRGNAGVFLSLAVTVGVFVSRANCFVPAVGVGAMSMLHGAVGNSRSPLVASSGLLRHARGANFASRPRHEGICGLSMAEEVSEKPAAAKGKSVLIIAWFYAEPKQIELVKRIYKKKGFDDIVVQESPVKQISTPRGWYNTYVRCQ